MSHLALLGGTPVMSESDYKARMFHWPIVNDAMRKAELDVLEDELDEEEDGGAEVA